MIQLVPQKENCQGNHGARIILKFNVLHWLQIDEVTVPTNYQQNVEVIEELKTEGTIY